jgi:hypothetical protein
VFLVMMRNSFLEDYHILAQNEVNRMNDGQFFAWIRDVYYAHRGILPIWFGLRVYSHCDFYKVGGILITTHFRPNTMMIAINDAFADTE